MQSARTAFAFSLQSAIALAVQSASVPPAATQAAMASLEAVWHSAKVSRATAAQRSSQGGVLCSQRTRQLTRISAAFFRQTLGSSPASLHSEKIRRAGWMQSDSPSFGGGCWQLSRHVRRASFAFARQSSTVPPWSRQLSKAASAASSHLASQPLCGGGVLQPLTQPSRAAWARALHLSGSPPSLMQSSASFLASSAQRSAQPGGCGFSHWSWQADRE